MQPYLSIIIPAYNEEDRLPNTLKQAFHFVQSQEFSAEVIVVENGSQDRTYQIALAFSKDHDNFRVVQEEKRGKGLAVRRGMLEACGQYRFMCDADLSMPINEISGFLPPDLLDFDLAIASREAPGAVRYNEPSYRHWGGRLVNAMIRMLALPGLNDTQCGFKCFKADVAEELFRCQTLPGWSFDIEILYIARLRGYKIVEVPIHWYFDPESKLRAVRDTFKILKDLFAVRWNHLRGIYTDCGH